MTQLMLAFHPLLIHCRVLCSSSILRRERVHTEDRVGRRNAFEVSERRLFVYWYMSARSRRPLQIRPQDGRPLVRGNLLEADLHAMAATMQYGHSVGRPNVLHPMDGIAKHGRQVASPINDGHDQG
jgi:hypothetical protein